MGNILNKIRWGWAFAHAKLTGKYIPLQVQFSITNNCNLHCTYCYANYPDRYRENLTTEQVFKIIDEVSECGTRRMSLVGGEPLIRKDIVEIVGYIKKKGIECAITTNGYLVKQKLDCVKMLDLLCVSIDGDMESNDINRGNGSYDKAIEAIELAKKNGITLQLATVINTDSTRSIDYMLGIAKKYGCMVGFATLTTQTVNGKKVRAPKTPTDEEYREILKHILKRKKEGYPVLFSEQSYEYAINWNLGYDVDKIFCIKPDFKYIKCNAGRYTCIIDANADVYPCPVLVDVIKPLNALSSGFKKSFEYINKHKCITCHSPCNNEINQIYSFKPSVLFNVLKNYRRNF